MDLIRTSINVIIPLILLILLLLISPIYFISTFISFIKRTISSENVAGKVVLITGAASGIGEQLAYEYARRKAHLVLVDINEGNLVRVSNRTKSIGSPEVLYVVGNVSKEEDCERFINQTINHFGKLNCLVSNAGIGISSKFEDITKISDHVTVMDVNFWGTVYCTHFAIPHLKKTQGKIVVISSISGCYPIPRISIYNASKAALINFCETLRTELGSKIGITIVTPGIVTTTLTQKSDMFSKLFIPQASSESCALEIVKSACRGDSYLTVPECYRWLFLTKVIIPQVVELCNRWIFMYAETISSKKQ